MRMYKEAQYAKQRLLETVVRWQGNAVLVKEISDGNVIFKMINSNSLGSCKFNELNIDPVPLGYCNLGVNCVYLARLPMREDWKQGLRFNNLRNSENLPVDIPWKNIAKTIEGVYPSFSDCLKAIKAGKIQSMAFSRNFAMDNNLHLTYKGNYKVGCVNDVDNYTLENKFIYLKEMAAEEIGFENHS